MSRDTIKDANEDLRDSVRVQRDGDANVITWGSVPAAATGVQVWASNSPFELVATLARGSTGFDDASFRHTGSDARAATAYIVTAFFGETASAGKVDSLDAAPGYAGLTEDEQRALAASSPDEDEGLPWWAWLLIILGVLLIIGLIVGLVIGARRAPAAEEEGAWDEGGAWNDEPWEDEAPSTHHDLTCPKCDQDFTAEGERPLHTTCPNCGVRGVLH